MKGGTKTTELRQKCRRQELLYRAVEKGHNELNSQSTQKREVVGLWWSNRLTFCPRIQPRNSSDRWRHVPAHMPRYPSLLPFPCGEFNAAYAPYVIPILSSAGCFVQPETCLWSFSGSLNLRTTFYHRFYCFASGSHNRLLFGTISLVFWSPIFLRL